MEDITVDIGNYKFNFRSTAIIIHNNKVLVHKNINKKHYGLLGGRVKTGETTAETLKREIYEELGKEVEILELFGTIENFFYMKKSNYHEILIDLDTGSNGIKNIYEKMSNIYNFIEDY